MIAAVCLQLATGWARARALEAKGKNFSLFHRVRPTPYTLVIHYYLTVFCELAASPVQRAIDNTIAIVTVGFIVGATAPRTNNICELDSSPTQPTSNH